MFNLIGQSYNPDLDHNLVLVTSIGNSSEADDSVSQELHENFLLLHAYLHPEVPLKPWVKKVPEYTSDYHKYWDSLIEIIEKLGAEHGWTIPQTLTYLEQIYYPEQGLSDKATVYDAVVLEVKRRKESEV